MNIFITGTDTNVGKTFVSTLLSLKLQYHYWKPIQCGLENNMGDSDWVGQFISKDKIYPEVYRLPDPLSPHIASKIQKQTIKLKKIYKFYPQKNTIIEGAGGLLVPINESKYIIDLIQPKKTKVILVSRSSLGTINHTLLSIKLINERKLIFLGVVMVGNRNHLNRQSIEKYGKTKVLAEIPIVKKIDLKTLSKLSKSLTLDNII